MATRKTREELDAEMDQMVPAEPEPKNSDESQPLAAEAAGESGGSDEVEASEVKAVDGGEAVAQEESGDSGGSEEVEASEEKAADEGEAVAEEESGDSGGSEEVEASEEKAADEGEAGPVEDSGDSGGSEDVAGGEEEPEPGAGEAAVDPALESRLKSLLESLLFAAVHPIKVRDLLVVIHEIQPDLSARALRKLLDSLHDDLRDQGRGLRVAEVAGGFQLRTPSDAAQYVKKLVARRPPRLTRATLETLAIVAYRQPVTRPEVEDIRGVDCGAVLRHLLEKKLVKILGRKDEAGRPLLYATTQDFLEFFGLKDLKSLPELRDFVELSDEHRAQLGLDAREPEVDKRESVEMEMAELVPEETDAYAPVGEDEVITELAEALDDLRQRDKDLVKSGVLPSKKKKEAQEEEQAGSQEGSAQGEQAKPDQAKGDQAQGEEVAPADKPAEPETDKPERAQPDDSADGGSEQDSEADQEESGSKDG